jgi:hypothetical protein
VREGFNHVGHHEYDGVEVAARLEESTGLTLLPPGSL